MKKFAVFILLLFAFGTWFHSRVSPESVLTFAKRKNHPEWSPKLEYWLGLYHQTRDQHAQAEAAFTQLLTEHPSSYYAPAARIKLGSTYYRTGERARSMEQFQIYLEQYPDGEFKSIAQKNIEMLKQ